MTDVATRMNAKIDTTTVYNFELGPCWTWQGSLDRGGYGKVSVDGRTMRTHRVMYALVHGEIATGLVLDHLCKNRACCNPTHLDPVTQWENVRRGDSPVGVMMRLNEK
jgi:hypothetical protein